MRREQPSVLGLVFLTVMLDMMGFSVIFPLFPAMLEHYVGLEGHASLIGQLVRVLSWSSPDTFTVVVLFGGVLGSIYSLRAIRVRSDLGDFVRPSGAPLHIAGHTVRHLAVLRSLVLVGLVRTVCRCSFGGRGDGGQRLGRLGRRGRHVFRT